jgi:hypothetical protein
MLPLADAFAQEVLRATLLIFSMGGVDVGALLLSAWLDMLLQRHRCRVSESRSSLVAVGRVAMLISSSLRILLCALGNRMLEWAGVGFADCVCKSHALRSGHPLQRCGHFQFGISAPSDNFSSSRHNNNARNDNFSSSRHNNNARNDNFSSSRHNISAHSFYRAFFPASSA